MNGRGGKNVLFLKNGASTPVRYLEHSLIYFEPFAVINHRGNIPDSSQLIPVSAIQISFVKHLLKLQ